MLNGGDVELLIARASTAMNNINLLDEKSPLYFRYENQGIFLAEMINAIGPKNTQPSNEVNTAGYNYVVSKDATGTITLSNIEQNKAAIFDGIALALGQDPHRAPTLGGGPS